MTSITNSYSPVDSNFSFRVVFDSNLKKMILLFAMIDSIDTYIDVIGIYKFRYHNNDEFISLRKRKKNPDEEFNLQKKKIRGFIFPYFFFLIIQKKGESCT